MKPFVSITDMTKLTHYTRRKICECEKPCKYAITINTYNDGMMVCAIEARAFFYDLARKLESIEEE